MILKRLCFAAGVAVHGAALLLYLAYYAVSVVGDWLLDMSYETPQLTRGPESA